MFHAGITIAETSRKLSPNFDFPPPLHAAIWKWVADYTRLKTPEEGVPLFLKGQTTGTRCRGHVSRSLRTAVPCPVSGRWSGPTRAPGRGSR